MAVCDVAGVPVTLKMRTGWCPAERNALRARARCRGGRRRDGHGARPHARAGLHAAMPSTTPWPPSRRALRIPVVANGDIDSPAEGPRRCSRYTGADAVMIGRAAQGPAVDLPRDRALPGHRRARSPAPADDAGPSDWLRRAPARPLRAVRRVRRRAHRAQAHRLVRSQAAAGWRGASVPR
ncbi:MAG: tRNA-dihydrouridine synthase [Burkholderiaceae bacterium]